jgi:hypothetical protein
MASMTVARSLKGERHPGVASKYSPALLFEHPGKQLPVKPQSRGRRDLNHFLAFAPDWL